MSNSFRFIVESGPFKGREIEVPVEGIRIGRSSRNDMSIDDAALSRFHCRIFVRPGEGLWVSDLGSANGTLVNGAEIQERSLVPGDVVALGGTTLRISQHDIPAVMDGAVRQGDAAFNLGFRRKDVVAGSGNSMRRWLFVALTGMLLLTVLAWLPWRQWLDLLMPHKQVTENAQPVPKLPEFEVYFERVEGTASNIFRYGMALTGNRLVIHVDDLATDRRVRREKMVDPELLAELSSAVENAGFFDLLPLYEGVAPGIHDCSDIMITIRSRAYRVKVLNHVEPDSFARVRSQLEEFSKNELGLAALAREPKELVNLAKDNYLLGSKLHDERDVATGNLAAAIRALMEGEWCLETIEPKPDFYAAMITLRNDCEKELQQRYDNIWFMAERSVKLREWKEAAKHLRNICEMIPDRSDDRNRNAYKKLVDVERRLATEK